MALPDPKKLNDADLAREIAAAHREVLIALQDRRDAGNRISDDGIITLDRRVYACEEHLKRCIGEKEARERSGAFKPVKTPPAKTVVQKPEIKPKAETKPQPRAKPVPPKPTASDWDEPEGVPIHVWDAGVLRRWRPGDPIH